MTVGIRIPSSLNRFTQTTNDFSSIDSYSGGSGYNTSFVLPTIRKSSRTTSRSDQFPKKRVHLTPFVQLGEMFFHHKLPSLQLYNGTNRLGDSRPGYGQTCNRMLIERLSLNQADESLAAQFFEKESFQIETPPLSDVLVCLLVSIGKNWPTSEKSFVLIHQASVNGSLDATDQDSLHLTANHARRREDGFRCTDSSDVSKAEQECKHNGIQRVAAQTHKHELESAPHRQHLASAGHLHRQLLPVMHLAPLATQQLEEAVAVALVLDDEGPLPVGRRVARLHTRPARREVFDARVCDEVRKELKVCFATSGFHSSGHALYAPITERV